MIPFGHYLNKKLHADIKHPIPSNSVTRIEIWHVHHIDYSFKEVHLRPNPFAKLTLMIYPRSCCKKGGDHAWHMFVDHCRQSGIGYTLRSYFNEYQAQKWQARLNEEAYCDWFDPHKVWEGIGNAMKVILSPPNNGPFYPQTIGAENYDSCE